MLFCPMWDDFFFCGHLQLKCSRGINVCLFFLIGFYWSYKPRACMERNLHQRWHLLNPSKTLVPLCDFDLIIKTHCEPLKLGFWDQQKINGMFPFSFFMEKSPQENWTRLFFVLWWQTTLCTSLEVGDRIWSSHLRCLTCTDRNAGSKCTKKIKSCNPPKQRAGSVRALVLYLSPCSHLVPWNIRCFFFSHPAIHANTSLIFFSRDSARATLHD